MKTTIDISQYDFSQLPNVFQIKDCPRSHHARIIAFTGENYSELEKFWFIHAQMHYINTETGVHLKEFTHPVKSKGESWVVDNNYSIILTNSAGEPLLNPDFQLTEEIEVQVGTDEETGEPIFETQTIDKEITYDNSPYKLMPAFDRYSGFKQRRENPVSMYTILSVAIANDDAMGYFDEKEYHPSVLDVVKQLWHEANLD